MEETVSRRERKKQETRTRLMEAALTLFRENGYTATTVEEITERADVAKGTFFNYFASKEALLGELSIWGVEKLRTVLDVNNGAPASPVGRIKLLLRLLHEQFGENMRLPLRAFAVRLYTPPPHKARQRLFDLMTDLVSEAQACGEIRADVDAELVSNLMHTSNIWLIKSCQGDGEKTFAQENLEMVIDLWMDGLAGPEWSK